MVPVVRNTLIDNSADIRLVDYLNRLISDESCTEICIATGYWDLKGTKLVYDKLAMFLENGGKLRLLIGEEPAVHTSQFHAEHPELVKFPDFYIQHDINQLTEEYLPVAQMLVDKTSFDESLDSSNSQIQIRVYGQKGENKKFLHAKCYIFKGEPGSDFAVGIIGSSNFTQRGIEDNAELNYLESDPTRVDFYSEISNRKSHVAWFEQMWEDESCEDWTGKFIQDILLKAPIAKAIKSQSEPEPELVSEIAPLTPYELYIKLLQTKYGDLVDKSVGQMIESYLPNSDEKKIHYSAYEYQIDAVKKCFNTMQEYGGFILADVVGLGKTIVGTLLIRHFIQYPDKEGRERKVLIITPPAIQSAWRRTIADFDAVSEIKITDYVEFITTGSLGRLVDDPDDDSADTGDFETELKYNNYGLIIVDESHKFRNSETRMYRLLDNLIAEIGSETGLYPYVGLLSATPQNNRPNDLKNQIYLFTRERTNSKFKKAKSGNIESYFAEINREYAALINHRKYINAGEQFVTEEQMTAEERNKRLKDLSLRLREDILDYIMIRRTRTDVKKYYGADMEKQGLVFPEVSGPNRLEYIMSPSLATLFSDTMNMIVPHKDFLFNDSNYICYYRYRAIQFLINPEEKQKYAARGSRDADVLAEQLAKIMQILLVKRLESSFSAFLQSLLNLKHYTDNMRKMWINNTIFICPDINVNAELDYKAKSLKRGIKVTFQDCVEDVRKKIAKLNEQGRNDDGSNREYTRDDFNPVYIELLNGDYEIIADLCERWGKNSEDPKLDKFKDALCSTLFDNKTNRPQKLVIFSEAIDTVDSIVKAAEAKGFAEKVLCVTAANRDELESQIIENFDANYKGEWKDEYQIIVTTDVLAEGINLHRANVILNYDTPWNSTRLMQRIGRVNRIGSTEKQVHVYNFMPSSEGDVYIDLVNKAYTKLQSFHTLFGEDSKIFTEEEELAHYELNTQMAEDESPLEKYLFELKEYKTANPERYEQIEQITEGLQMATTIDGVGYFVVKAPRAIDFYVAVDPNAEEGTPISWPEMLQRFKSEPDIAKTNLPTNWEDMRKEAERVVIAELASVRLRQGNSARATKAKGIIVELKNSQKMSKESKKLLNDASALIRHGNPDMVNCILTIGEAVARQNALIPYTQEEFDEYIKKNLAKIVEHVQQRNGKPEVTIAIYKA